MRSLTCIVCPIGCSLDIEENCLPDGCCMPDGCGTPDGCGSSGVSRADNLSVTGNRCPRGAVYALEEIRAPKRVVTATCRINDGAFAGRAASVKRVPVKTASPCPREKIPALLRDIYGLEIPLPVKAGDVLVSRWNGEDMDIIATRTIS